jgi:hypothetical protein
MSYNGWSNYETWRANLELVDGMTLEDLGMDPESSADDVGTALEEYFNEYLGTSTNFGSNFVNSLVHDFLRKVDWVEIAEHLVEDAVEYAG